MDYKYIAEWRFSIQHSLWEGGVYEYHYGSPKPDTNPSAQSSSGMFSVRSGAHRCTGCGPIPPELANLQKVSRNALLSIHETQHVIQGNTMKFKPVLNEILIYNYERT
jgi:hypothetical protein